MLHLSFDISTADQASRAADILDAIAAAFGENVSQSDTGSTAVRTRRPRTAKVAPATSESLAAAYDALAAAQRAAPIADTVALAVENVVALNPVETPSAVLATQVETVKAIVADDAEKVAEAEKLVPAGPAHKQVTIVGTVTAGPSRDDMTKKIKELAAGFGFIWVRENVTAVYGRTKLDELTDDEVAVVHGKAIAKAAESGL